MFRQMDLKGQASVDTKLKSTHQNTVNTIRTFEEANGQVRSFSSKYSHGVRCLTYTNVDLSERCGWPCCDLVYLSSKPSVRRNQVPPDSSSPSVDVPSSLWLL